MKSHLYDYGCTSMHRKIEVKHQTAASIPLALVKDDLFLHTVVIS